MLQRDNLPAKKAEGLEAFGIKPTALASVAPGWLQRYRQGGRWSSRIMQQAA
jgi:NADH dehydrogenase